MPCPRLLSLFACCAFLPATVAIAQSTTQSPDPARCPPSRVALADGLAYLDHLTVKSPTNFLHDHAARRDGGLVTAVVEIPAGTVEKWEVKREDGVMRWDIKDGQPRQVKYLGYPCNYGMVPRTCLGKELGGDGDPLDVLVLGAALPRGSLVPVKIIGLIQLVDAGEKDDKLIAVPADSPFAQVDSVKQLDAKFPGITAVLRTWFENYKGPGQLQCQGFGDAAAAMALLQAACESYEKNRPPAGSSK
jgi:inorganic pyrophosphatase